MVHPWQMGPRSERALYHIIALVPWPLGHACQRRQQQASPLARRAPPLHRPGLRTTTGCLTVSHLMYIFAQSRSLLFVAHGARSLPESQRQDWSARSCGRGDPNRSSGKYHPPRKNAVRIRIWDARGIIVTLFSYVARARRSREARLQSLSMQVQTSPSYCPCCKSNYKSRKFAKLPLAVAAVFVRIGRRNGCAPAPRIKMRGGGASSSPPDRLARLDCE
jgi:hypothetical protein